MCGSPEFRVHLLRHAQVASHRGDVPLTETGRQQAETEGRRLAESLAQSEVPTVLYAPTQRALQTATALHAGLSSSLEGQNTDAPAPTEEQALRNPDLYVAGTRVEMVSTAEDLAVQLPPWGPGAKELSGHHFFREFWGSDDRVGYWVSHPSPPGEDSTAVGRRLVAFASSLREVPTGLPQRYLCVTHSPIIRALLRCFFEGGDPGEPDYLEALELSASPGEALYLSFRKELHTSPSVK